MSDADDRLPCAGFLLRPWRADDVESLQRHADDAEVSRFLSDRFPYPYTTADAAAFLASPAATGLVRAIEVDGVAVGGIGAQPGQDIFRMTATIGYWLSRAYWGRGLMRRAVERWSAHLLTRHPFERLEARVCVANPASARVLVHAGFELEGHQRRAMIKRGEILDVLLYARLRSPQDGVADRR
ncbi:MAG: GNAT family N-acetyltransferase [Rhodanobacter denitrificans]|uniref:GNAT family N-acetyltransferase n=1 Tax=Rhodanobacter denitrificans TaxID=666685 RepID=A0A2W5K1Q7_9GAMM|nr:MAG: GNAT family N-acetyltransferase [Rhodanobacter denitrificans]